MKVLFEDKDFLALDKPAGILVHPTEKDEKNTIVSWFQKKYPEIKKLDWLDPVRPGVVHRLDKDTSGVLILAKTPLVLKKLQDIFQTRQIQKTYLALVLGKAEPKEGKIEAAITRGKAGSQKVLETTYSFSKERTRPAVTLYKVKNYYKYGKGDLSLVEAEPQTGRMHQIRVHLKHIGHPIIGDPLYNTKESRKLSKELNLDRQFLHAEKLEFQSPTTDKRIVVESKLPEELKSTLLKLEEI